MADTPVDEELWQEFHSLVNMSSAELQAWLATQDSSEATEVLPDQAGDERSQAVLDILRKRRTDLTSDDVEVMRSVTWEIRTARGQEPEPAAGDEEWRRRLMSIGHDPLREVGS